MAMPISPFYLFLTLQGRTMLSFRFLFDVNHGLRKINYTRVSAAMLPLPNGSNIRWSFPNNYICVVKLFAPNYVFSLHMLIIGAGNSHIALYLIGDRAALVANCLFLPETSQGCWLWSLAGKRYWISRSESTLYWESFKNCPLQPPRNWCIHIV